MYKSVEIKGGLVPLPVDDRDFSLAGIFKQIEIFQMPDTDFTVANPLVIKDQGDTDFCSAYAVSEVTEDQEGIEMLPEYQFFKTKELTGDPDEWGADLRNACKVLVKFGSLPKKDYPRTNLSRADVLNPATWPKTYDSVAADYRKQAFFSVDGRYDIFDNIRIAMWQNWEEKRTIVVGCMWKSQWTYAKNGIIPKESLAGGFGHAFKIFGQKLIDGELYLMAQLSNGTDIGDGGIFYFPREVVNREFEGYGQFMFKDLPASTIKSLKEQSSKNCFSMIISNFKSLFTI